MPILYLLFDAVLVYVGVLSGRMVKTGAGGSDVALTSHATMNMFTKGRDKIEGGGTLLGSSLTSSIETKSTLSSGMFRVEGRKEDVQTRSRRGNCWAKAFLI